jgi:hypothetical protein
MQRRVAISILMVGVALTFFFAAPVIYVPIGSVRCYPFPAYTSPSYALFRSYGVFYTPTTGWVDFPPLSFHDAVCLWG